MCLSPQKIRSRSRYINAGSLHKVFYEVPCGKCAECLNARKNEYYFRSYYQALETFDKGGYCLFDTLTYDDDHIHWFSEFLPDGYSLPGSDFTCFCYEDVRKFFVRLRRSLEYHGIDVKNSLRYFLCSEYGEDPRYTHRPHYHVMFYVTTPDLDPITLSNYVNKCWGLGRTDGAYWKGAAYVLSKRVFYKGQDDLHMQSICSYLGKYMLKDSEFERLVTSRLDDVFTSVWNRQYEEYGEVVSARGNRILKGDYKVLYRELKRHVSQFTRQSLGFGKYMIDKLTPEWIIEHGCVQMPDKDNVVKQIPIPNYIVTKLFKEKKIDAQGEVYYGWSEFGNEWRQSRASQKFDDLKKRYVDFFSPYNLRGLGLDDDGIKFVLHRVTDWLDGRSLDDLVYYEQFMKGRLYIPENGEEPDFESFAYADQRQLVSTSSIARESFFDGSDDDMVYVIDNYVYRDTGFDNIQAMYQRLKAGFSKERQAAYDEKILQQKLWKKLGWNCKNN